MDAEGIRELFAEVLPVRIRRMFGGSGIYDGDVMFALEAGGDIYLKADAGTRTAFEQAGSIPFSFEKNGKSVALSYWRLPDMALDDGEELRRWTDLALAAARAAKPLKRPGSSPRRRPR